MPLDKVHTTISILNKIWPKVDEIALVHTNIFRNQQKTINSRQDQNIGQTDLKYTHIC